MINPIKIGGGTFYARGSAAKTAIQLNTSDSEITSFHKKMGHNLPLQHFSMTLEN